VYQNYIFQIADQQANAITNGVVKVTEAFSNVLHPPGPNPSMPTLDLSSQGYGDTQYLGHNYPTCLATNENQAFDMSFTVSVGSTNFQLSTVIHITKGNFNGSLNVTSAITTP